MPWTCPNCQRQFTHENQYHSCRKITVDSHFVNKSDHIRAIYDRLMQTVTTWKDVRIEAVKNAIMVKAGSTFLAVKPKKQWLDVEFTAEEDVYEFPVFKSQKYSANKWALYVRLEDPNEVNDQLLQWIRDAYQISLNT